MDNYSFIHVVLIRYVGCHLILNLPLSEICVASPSPWDMVYPSPAPIRAGGSTPSSKNSKQNSGRHTPRGSGSHQLRFRAQATPHGNVNLLHLLILCFIITYMFFILHICLSFDFQLHLSTYYFSFFCRVIVLYFILECYKRSVFSTQ